MVVEGRTVAGAAVHTAMVRLAAAHTSILG